MCKKSVKKDMVVHLKTMHKVPQTCEDFAQIYQIFARQPYVKPQDALRTFHMNEFEKHLMQRAGGSKNQKQAKQHRRQAEAIIKSSGLSIPDLFKDVETVLYDEKKGFITMKRKGSNWKIGTIRSYLFSLKSYLSYLMTKKENVLDGLIAMKADKVLEGLISSTASDMSERKKEHATETASRLLTAAQLEEYLNCSKVNELAHLLKLVQEEGPGIVMDKGINSLITYLAVHVIIDSSCSSSLVLDAKVSDFLQGQQKEDGSFQLEVLGSGGKKILLSKELYKEIRIYQKSIRPNLTKEKDPGTLFVNLDGGLITRQTFTNHIARHFEKTINVPNVTPTLLKLSVVNIIDMATPALKLLSTQDPQTSVRKALNLVKAMEVCSVETRNDLNSTDDEYQTPLVSDNCGNNYLSIRKSFQCLRRNKIWPF